ncbi:MAG: hypothetical protein CMB99_05490 [Flavobacteriaceae bacterium]|nr:hypothetical protein [Flavobacteriaceae bacterium]|tara:strand:- start:3453 stop:3914 length:462 start_codon:yes stop_codon:yes gene_type:complete
MVRKTLFIVLCWLSISLSAQEDLVKSDSLTWEPFYKAALKKAKKERKPVLIYFKGSDWCAPCKIIEKELFLAERFQKMANSSLILLEVDIPRDMTILSTDKLRDNLVVQKKYRVNSFPTLLFVNHRGRKIAEKKGYILTDYYYPFIEKVIRRY